MTNKRFEDDGDEYNNSYNYALLDTYYEFDGKRIIEWNKYSSNAEYTDFERITEILNIKQMRLESLMKHREDIGKLFDRIDEQQATIENYRKSRDKWRTKCHQTVDYWKHKSLELYKLLRKINLSDREWEEFLNIINEKELFDDE